MKKLFLFILGLILLSNTSYNTIYDLRTLKKVGLPSSEAQAGDYYKDIHNDLNKFVGLWKYSDNGIEIEIIIAKKTRVKFISSQIFVDKLSIEYKVYENGVLVKESDPGFWSTLSQMEVTNIYKTTASSISDYGYTQISSVYRESFDNSCKLPFTNSFNITYKTTSNSVSGQQTLGTLYFNRGRMGNSEYNGSTSNCIHEYSVPENMILIKQP
ncbi:DUF6705 family protein [Nonlabens sp.]|uniref:DUF6705 family protein n=1 Tax=unclassified Nonlabens TaxID=2615035 RepID=UPI003266E686